MAPEISRDAWHPGSSSIGEPEVFPPAFRGTWAPDRAACADEDGVNRIAVGPGGLDMYESGGRLERITQAGQPRSVRVRLSFEGEGSFDDTEEVWTLNASGDRLTRTIERPEGRNGESLLRCD